MSARARTGLLLCACALSLLLALSLGPTGWRWLWSAGDSVIYELRAPRALLAGLVGASLAIAGVAMQTLLHNDLAEPYVLGLSGGAAAFAVLSLACFPALPPGPAAALGALAAAWLVRSAAGAAHDTTRLLLAGVAIGSLLASATGLVLVLAPNSQLLRSSSYWLFGGLGTPRAAALLVPAAALGLAAAWLVAHSEALDRLSLGDDVAATLGTQVTALQRGVLVVSVLLTAAAVAASGLVGFVGLIAPHAARRWVGPRHRALLPVAGLLGFALLVAADTAARTAFAPREVPVGLLTAALGGPLFLWQLQRTARAPVSAAPGAGLRAAGSATGQSDAPVAPGGPADRGSTRPAAVLSALDLSVGRGAGAVLSALQLELYAGERVALIGQNGSGKTTLLRVLSGLDAPLSGCVRWAQGPLPRGAARVRVLGVVLQHETRPAFTVRELVTLGLGVAGRPSAAQRQQVDDALRRAELSALGDRACCSLSGGEAQRAALARALVGAPRLLLLDEPTQHLDPGKSAALRETLEGLRGEVAVLVATHDLDLAASCDRVVLLGQGVIAAIGTPDAVLTPALLARTLGIAIERIDDPRGGPLRVRVLPKTAREVAA